ncbi:ribosomal protein L1 [Glonium stellatum]|uniref:Ribosomal protein L1 n=1 Tax=Glonium stellatum TaxID=574774 RepID=A0A8E2JQP7_9PEZI|nr:ribosomal protein L1 [Glonium stellatum]
MAKTETRLTTKVAEGTPYQLDPSQTIRAAEALVKHIKAEQKRIESSAAKKSLLTEGDSSEEEAADEEDVPVWLVLGTKKHVADQKRLKPSKIVLPHPINTSPTTRICLITADPQRSYKDLVAHPSFPSSLSSRIGRVIGTTKLKAKYKSFESRRQLLAEYDVFLADDRIITYLPKTLGKIFYKGTSKRPIPVNLAAGVKSWKDSEGKKVKSEKGASAVGAPQNVAREIEAALQAALVHISPSVTTAIKVARASMVPQEIVENVEAVVKGLMEKFVPKGWRNVRSLHIKGPNTMALPIWLADELWVDEEDILEEKWKPVEGAKEHKNEKKRKWEEWEDELLEEGDKPVRKVKKSKEQKAEADNLAKEAALRKQKLKKQKEEALKAIEAPPVKAIEGTEKSKKSKKSKAIAA